MSLLKQSTFRECLVGAFLLKKVSTMCCSTVNYPTNSINFKPSH